MAYMNQERKAELAPAIKAVFKKYGINGSIAVRNHMALVVSIKSGPIDFFESYNRVSMSRFQKCSHSPAQDCMDVNPYRYHDHFDGVAHDCLEELITAMNAGNHNNSDIQSDYFDVGWYANVSIGKWNKPYTLHS
jgi:hypothetical protein